MSLVYAMQAYIFRDYWADIGTIKSFYEANLALTEEVGVFFKILWSLNYVFVKIVLFLTYKKGVHTALFSI